MFHSFTGTVYTEKKRNIAKKNNEIIKIEFKKKFKYYRQKPKFQNIIDPRIL